MRRGYNPDFLVKGIQAIFKKNWGISIDSHEIDLTLSYSENFEKLYVEKVSMNRSSMEEMF